MENLCSKWVGEPYKAMCQKISMKEIFETSRESGVEVTIDTVCTLTLYSVVLAVYAGNGLYLYFYSVYL